MEGSSACSRVSLLLVTFEADCIEIHGLSMSSICGAGCVMPRGYLCLSDWSGWKGAWVDVRWWSGQWLVYWSVWCWGQTVDGGMCGCGRVRKLELSSASIYQASSILPFLIGGWYYVHIVPESDPFLRQGVFEDV